MTMDYLLAAILITATVTDFKYRRIPNWLIGSGLVVVILYYSITGGWSGVVFSIKGLALGIGLLIIPFAVGGMGAGDAKLLGLVGAAKGAAFAANAFLWMAVWGGLMAVLVLLRQGRLGSTILNLLPGCVKYSLSFKSPQILLAKREKVLFPYALAITLGVLCAYLKGWW